VRFLDLPGGGVVGGRGGNAGAGLEGGVSKAAEFSDRARIRGVPFPFVPRVEAIF